MKIGNETIANRNLRLCICFEFGHRQFVFGLFFDTGDLGWILDACFRLISTGSIYIVCENCTQSKYAQAWEYVV